MTSLRKAFEKKMNLVRVMHQIDQEFNIAYNNSKYGEIEIPDELIDTLDYGTGKKITYERFIELMDEALEESKS